MKWATFRDPLTQLERVAVVRGDELCAMQSGITLLQLLNDATALMDAGARVLTDPSEVFAVAGVEHLGRLRHRIAPGADVVPLRPS